MKLDQNTTVSLTVVGTIVGAMVYGGYVAGQFSARLDKLDAVKIETRLTSIETTLQFMVRRQAGMITADHPVPFSDEAARQ